MAGVYNRPKRLRSVYPYVDKEGNKREGKGYIFIVDGTRVELFTSMTLMAVMHRQQKTLYEWEVNFGFPQAMWRVSEDRQNRRWYSRKQIDLVKSLYEGKYKKLRKENRTKLLEFTADLRKMWAIVDVPVEILNARRKEPNPVTVPG